MKNFKNVIILVSVAYFVICTNKAFSQDTTAIRLDTVALKLNIQVHLITGKLDSLRNAKIVNIEFKYDSTKVGKMTEIDYIDKKLKELNEKKAGKGDEWLVKWNEKKSLSETWMILLLNKNLTKAKLTFKKNCETAKYTLVINILWIEEGWDAVVWNYQSVAALSLSIIETQNKSKKIATLNCVGIGASGYLERAYGNAGMKLGKAIYKYLYP